jgi:predicted porin
MWKYLFLVWPLLFLSLGNIANAGFNEDISLQTYQGDNPSASISGDVKYCFPKSGFAIVTSVLYGMHDLDTESSTTDWAYSIGGTYDIGKHLSFNADYIYKTYDSGYMVYELENSPSVVRVGMTLHF